MKKHLLILLAAVCSTVAQALPNKTYEAYVEQWKAMALLQQQDYHIPAAITLAQGLLESAGGTSELAVQANNHFGIKCTSEWMGAVYRHDDETAGECFRSYADAGDSFIDHSKFLMRSRYARLFELDIRDYARWAQGLKDCGYATDPLYPQKLLRVIEEYRLDTIGVPADAPTDAPAGQATSTKPVVVTQAAVIGSFVEEKEEEYVAPLSARQERKNFYMRHGKERTNGCRFVFAREGDTYATIAFSLNMKERTLREYNDALGRTLKPWERVYLVKKKKQAPKDREHIWVSPGETTWEIAQREGVQLKYILKYNGWKPDVRTFKTRQTILLRKPKKEK